jgi:serine protease Do
MTLRRLLLIPVLYAGLLTWVVPTRAADADTTTKTPATVAEMRDLQKKVQEVYKRVLPTVVGIQIGGSSGSGVIVSEDGYILTAGHVSGKPDTKCTIILPDGKRVNAKSLGQNRGIDSGMLKITDDGKWPYAEMGDATKLKKGQWTVAIGHPGGYYTGRSPVLRLGRVQDNRETLIQTDCTLVGGDSGGPLFDLDGKVIGIHSRIGPSIAYNIHVPVTTYRETWDRLAKGESWGGLIGTVASKPSEFGAKFNLNGGVLSVTEVKPGSLADKAGLKAKDMITKFDGQSVVSKDDIDKIIKKKKSGEELAIEIDRGIEKLKLKLTIKDS